MNTDSQYEAITEGEFLQLFRERFGREYGAQPFSREESDFVMEHIMAVLYQFTYSDPVTGLTYEVFYDFDVDESQPVVAYARLGSRKVRLTSELRHRMTEAAFEQWMSEGIKEGLEEDSFDTMTAEECAYLC
jgi:hypothetical protein